MKKGIILTAYILLFSGGLFCLHMTAQLGVGVRGALASDELSITPVSLLDQQLDEYSERELLEMRVAIAQKSYSYTARLAEEGIASLEELIEAKVDLADVEIEFYLHIGDQEALRTALQAKVDCRKQQLLRTNAHNEAGSMRGTSEELRRAEMQLLDAVLEQKRVLASLNEKDLSTALSDMDEPTETIKAILENRDIRLHINETTTFADLFRQIKDELRRLKLPDINIDLDRKALQNTGEYRSDTIVAPEGYDYPPMRLRSVLARLLSPHDLTYIIRDETLLITTVEEAKKRQATPLMFYPIVGPIVPPNIGKQEVLVEKPINYGKAIKIQHMRGDEVEKLSVVMCVRVRKQEEKKFDKLYDECKHAINDRISTMLFASSLEDRMEVGMTAIKEKAKKAINEVLGIPIVQEVLVTEVVFQIE
jgi:hypothetical protein